MQTRYGSLVNQNTPATAKPKATTENELDALIDLYQQKSAEGNVASGEHDNVVKLRADMVNVYVPAFVELVEKYAERGVSMHMDASNFLQGGREIKFEFAIGEHRAQLHGTVTSEAIAFHEVRYSPDFHGELAAGPMLRIRRLDVKSFREFICGRLAILVRSASRRR